MTKSRRRTIILFCVIIFFVAPLLFLYLVYKINKSVRLPNDYAYFYSTGSDRDGVQKGYFILFNPRTKVSQQRIQRIARNSRDDRQRYTSQLIGPDVTRYAVYGDTVVGTVNDLTHNSTVYFVLDTKADKLITSSSRSLIENYEEDYGVKLHSTNRFRDQFLKKNYDQSAR